MNCNYEHNIVKSVLFQSEFEVQMMGVRLIASKSALNYLNCSCDIEKLFNKYKIVARGMRMKMVIHLCHNFISDSSFSL